MIPKDLAPFSIEQLRGFQSAVKLAIADAKADAKGDPDKLATLEGLLDERERLDAAIAAVLNTDGEAAEDEASDPVVEGDDAEATEDDDAADGEGADDAADDTEAAVDDAIASAALGGGTGPRVKSEPNRSQAGDIRKFLQSAMGGNVANEHRLSFSTLQRETNFRVKDGADASEAIRQAREGRRAGTDKTAAGCFCGPDDARNEICTSLVTDRPFCDTLPTITANGDYRFIRQLTGPVLEPWLCADQDLVDPEVISTWKPCFELDCPPEVVSETYAIPACATFTTQQLIGNPQLIDNLVHVMQVAYNRAAELECYQRVVNESTCYNYGLHATSGYGASAQIIAAVAWAFELMRQNFRDTKGYFLALPAGTRERVLADGLVRGIDDYRAWDDLLTRLEALGVENVIELLDPIGAVTPLAAPGGVCVAAPAHELVRQLLLYRPDNFILGLNPEIDLGVTRSPELARQNKLQWFIESFESVERVCIDPNIVLNVPLCLSGIRPALGEGTDCA